MPGAVAAAPQRAFGRGRLVAKSAGGRTRLQEFYQEGCAKLRLPTMFDGSMEAVLINSSGGLTGGDVMDWRFGAGTDTELTLTTQACEKIYKASAGTTSVTTTIRAEAGSRVHWLPQETILFDRASMTRSLDVELAADAEFLAVEAVLLGRAAMGERMRSGLFRDRWRIVKGGTLLHAENMRLSGDIDALTRRAFSLSGHVAFATLFFTAGGCERHLKPLRERLETGAGRGAGGVSHVVVGDQEKLVARIVAKDGFALRKILVPMISHLRRSASVPKVWSL
ncbi:urease accessory protein UreD [Rhizobium sp. DKSPLA3]|uniref:Urease accessory protein UreD n=1 Tax=Rhizobium quercicola TaxID=2901226 RepID=A0A9X1T088_9HYPH|nr:urease accessory protein UreD [Rhizobium quercicola]MCD7109197.1 urease accessory protein UreD [Rhizobium quercicola]